MGVGYSSEYGNIKTKDEVQFMINGQLYKVKADGKEVTATTPLNSFIRNVAQLKGTKYMCCEGGCGSCIVVAEFIHPVTQQEMLLAVNSCLVTVLSCQGWKITTVEGIGNNKEGYHIIQKRLAEFNGTQCGFCSPGMVMNMYSLYELGGNLTQKQIENSFGGNICRCTGYRSIADSFKSLACDADPTLLKKCEEIENLENLQFCTKGNGCCKNRNGSCSEKIGNNDFTYISIDLGVEKWFKVYKLSELLEILRRIDNAKYMLVAGNTANGVFRRDRNIEVYIDVNSVAELHEVSVGIDLTLGGNITLTECMKVMSKLAKEKEEFLYLQEIVDHYDLVANVPVRNIGTIAGNLMLKHQYPRFQSDIFVTLETFGAKLEIMSKSNSAPKYVSPVEFLDLDMNGKIISKIILSPLFGYHVFRTYKIMPRAQNTHAIVNAGFLIQLGPDLTSIMAASIVYGAINAGFTHAKETEQYLIGKKLFSDETLQEAYQILDKELECDEAPPDPSPEVRKQLAISLFYKFILNVAPSHLVNERYLSGGPKFDRPVSSGKQIYQTKPDEYPLTKPVPKVEALAQCSGEARYVIDHDITRNDFVFGQFVIATARPASIIKKINTEEAMKLPGVVGVFTSNDIPGVNSFIPKETQFITNQPEEIFCSGEVKYNGQPVALVVATSEGLAMHAAALVTIDYLEPPVKRKLVYTTRDAISILNNPRVNLESTKPRKHTGKNISKVIKGTFDIGEQYHFTMETLTCVCVPIEDGMDVYPSTQWMDLAQMGIAQSCNIPEKNINISVRRLGGGYGVKISRCNLVICACALAAKKLQRPVYVYMPMETMAAAVGKRFPFSADYEAGVDPNGKIQYMNLSMYSNYGYQTNESFLMVTMEAVLSCYDSSTWEVRGYSVLTDIAASCFCRAPGTLEGISLIESIMDHIALEVDKTPSEIRLQNMAQEDNPVPGLLKEFSQKSELDERLRLVTQFNRHNRWRKRGIGVVTMSWPFEYAGNFYANISIYAGDGTVAVSHGAIEMGQGVNTKVAQVVAYELGLDLDMVQVKPSNVLVSPNNIVTGGSVGSESACYAALQACKVLKKRLQPLKEKLKNATWPQLIRAAHNEFMELSASYQFTTKDNVKNYHVYGVTIAEVEVDILTGLIQVKRVDLLEDTGESMSPEIDIGQIEGAFVMGMGYWLTEVFMYDADGKALTTRTWTYHPPGMKDIPVDWRIEFRRNSSNPNGVLRSKATAEPPLCMSISIPLAIRRALESARNESDANEDRWFKFDGPTTTSQIILSSLSNYKQYTLK